MFHHASLMVSLFLTLSFSRSQTFCRPVLGRLRAPLLVGLTALAALCLVGWFSGTFLSLVAYLAWLFSSSRLAGGTLPFLWSTVEFVVFYTGSAALSAALRGAFRFSALAWGRLGRCQASAPYVSTGIRQVLTLCRAYFGGRPFVQPY